MKLTNQQIEDACVALEAFNPECHLRTKLRLNRNLRLLQAARRDKEHDRLRLNYSVVKDKERKMEANGAVTLSVDEAMQLQKEYRELMRTEIELDLHPVVLFDGEEGPCADQTAIDVSKVAIENRILNALLDVVFVEFSAAGHGQD